MGIITSRRGAGTFIVEGPPHLGKAPLEFLAALHGFTLDHMYEARRCSRSAPPGSPPSAPPASTWPAMADELTGMFATLDDPQVFLRHDLGFHRAVAAGSGNPIVAAIIGTLTEIIWETGRINMSGFSLRESAETHRRIYEAIRARSPERARREMSEHLEHARWEQVEAGDGRGRSPRARPLSPPRGLGSPACPLRLLRDVVVGPQLVLDVDAGFCSSRIISAPASSTGP